MSGALAQPLDSPVPQGAVWPPGNVGSDPPPKAPEEVIPLATRKSRWGRGNFCSGISPGMDPESPEDLVKNAVSRAPPQLLNSTVLECGLGGCITQSSPGDCAATGDRGGVGDPGWAVGRPRHLTPVHIVPQPAPSSTLLSPAHSSSFWRFGGQVVIDKGPTPDSGHLQETRRPFPARGRQHALLSLSLCLPLSDILAFGFF